jgi:hypothetical protein
MPVVARAAPALFWRALFIPALLGMSLSSVVRAAPAPKPPELAQVDKPNPAEAARLIQEFRKAGIPGEYYLEFDLVSLPRRGESRSFQGRSWGSRNDQGVVTRIELTDAAGAVHRLLLQNGERARVWKWSHGKTTELAGADLLAPLIAGLEVSAFDLQMPYLYWPNPTVDKITRILGRPSHAFIFRPPPAFTVQHPEIGAIRAYLDTQFNAPTQTEVIGPEGKITKTMALLALKTVDRQTLPKAVDYRNEVTRDKTRLQTTAAALNLTLPASLFDASSLGQSAISPPTERVVRID